MARTGKIARLPRHIRDALNRRLESNPPGRRVLAWLNNLPEVKALLEIDFLSNPVNEQNLSEWRRGGFLEWQTSRDLLGDVRESTFDADELAEASPQLAERAARLLTARFLVAIRNWNGDPDSPVRVQLKTFFPLIRALAVLRRGEHSAARLHMEQHAFDLATQSRDKLQPDEAQTRPVSSPPVQKWSRRFNVPTPEPSPDPDREAICQVIRSLSYGEPLPAHLQPRSPHPPVPPPPTPTPPPLSPSSSPTAPQTKSSQIKITETDPSSPQIQCPPEAAATQSPPPQNPPSPSSAPNHSPDPSPIHASPINASPIVTEPMVTIPPNTSSAPPPTPPPPQSDVAREAGVTDAELWEMRYRDLPGDLPPAWRLTLPIPPWAQHPYHPPDPPVHSIVGHR